MKKIYTTLWVFALATSFPVYSQAQGGGVGVSRAGFAPDPSAILDINDNQGGVLFPRMTELERDAIVSPANFLLILNMDSRCFEAYNASKAEWQKMFCLCDYPAAPNVLPPSNIGFSSFRANWDTVPGATHYYIDMARDSGFQQIIPGFQDLFVGHGSYVDMVNLNFCDSTLYYRVRAAISCGSGSSSVAQAAVLGACVYCLRIGGAGDDQCTGIVPMSDGGFIAGGRGRDQADSYYKFMFVRVTPNKTLAWSKGVGGTNGYDDYSGAYNSVCQTSDGGVVMGGYSASGFVGSTGYSKFYAVKMDQNGNIVWTRAVGASGASHEYGDRGIAATLDGGVAMGGTSTTSGWTSNSGYRDFVVVKLNQDGSHGWTRYAGRSGSTQDYMLSIAAAPDGSIIAAGYANSGPIGSDDWYMIKFNSSGTVQWNRVYGESNGDRPYAVVTDANGNIYVGGRVNGIGAGDADACLLKLDPNGNVQWDKIVGGANYDSFHSLTIDPTGDVIAVGRTNSFGFGSNDVFVCKFDTNGNLIASKAIGSTGYESGYTVTALPGGTGYYVGGYTDFQTFGSYDWYVAKLDAQLNGCCTVNIFPQVTSGGSNTTVSTTSGTPSVSTGTGGSTFTYGSIATFCE